MARTEFTIFIEPDDFDRFRVLIRNDPEFPASFDEFKKRADELSAKSQSRGHVAKKVVVHPDEYIVYCRAAGLEHNTATLGSFAILKGVKDR